MATAECVFITGVPRSGTTLVSMVLSAHSMICISPESHYFIRYYRKGERNHCFANDTQFERFIRFTLDSHHIQSFHFTSSELDRIYTSLLTAGDRSHRAVLGTILSAYASKRGKAIFGEKTPMHMHHIPEIMSAFPNGRIIHIIRDPRDVVLSLQRVNWERGNMLEHLKQWKRSVYFAAEYSRRYPGRFLALKYESLLKDPQQTTRSICNFLGVEFESEMLSHHSDSEPNFDVRSEPWKTKALFAIDSRNQMKWTSNMPDDERTIVDIVAGKELRQTAYPEWHGIVNVRVLRRLALLYVENLILVSLHWMKRARLRLADHY